MAKKEGNVDADIESGHIPLRTGHFASACSTLSKTDGSMGKVSEKPTSFVPKSGDHTSENLQVVIDTNQGIECREMLALAEKGYSKEKRLKSCSIKHPKPPRPPKGPLLKASDMDFVRQISEIAALKRARIERLRALKKMKAAKGSPTSSNVTAVVMSILFFIVIILQGVCSRGGISAGFHGSPEPSVANKALITMAPLNLQPANEINGPVYRYPNFREAPRRSGPQMEDGWEAQ